MLCAWGGAAGAPSTSAVNYNSLVAVNQAWNANEDNTSGRMVFPLSDDITVTKLTVWVTTAPASGKSWAFTIRDDAADTAATVTISNTATTASWSGTASIAQLSKVCLKSAPTGTPTASGNVFWAIEYTTGGDYFLLASQNSNFVSSGTGTYYYPPCGGNNVVATTTATDNEIVCPTGLTVTKIAVYLNAAPGGANTNTFTVRKNN